MLLQPTRVVLLLIVLTRVNGVRPRYPIDEQQPINVVQFMLKGPRLESICLNFDRFSAAGQVATDRQPARPERLRQ